MNTAALRAPVIVPNATLFDPAVPGNSPVRATDPACQEYIPEIKNGYIFRTEYVMPVLACIVGGITRGVSLVGPTGCGKTSLILQMCGTLNIPVFRVACHRRVTHEDLVGRYVLVGQKGVSNMEWRDGPLALAMRHHGILLLDEADLLDPAESTALNTVLDGHALEIHETGERLSSPFFRIVMSSNTGGLGDTTGLYRGASRQHAGLLERFLTVKIGYLDPSVERPMLKEAAPCLTDETVDTLLHVAKEVRNLFVNDAGSIDVTISTRTLISWAQMAESLIASGTPNAVLEALHLAVTNRSDNAATRDAIAGILQRCTFGPDTLGRVKS